MKFVGDRHLRKEDPRLLTGRGRYVADIALPGLLHAVLLRSPHAHARIARVDSTRARVHPGVVDVVAFADLGLVVEARDSTHAAEIVASLELAGFEVREQLVRPMPVTISGLQVRR